MGVSWAVGQKGRDGLVACNEAATVLLTSWRLVGLLLFFNVLRRESWPRVIKTVKI